MDASVYKLPNKPDTMAVIKRKGTSAMVLPVVPELVCVDRPTECHVTPSATAERMVDYLGPVDDFLTLEQKFHTLFV